MKTSQILSELRKRKKELDKEISLKEKSLQSLSEKETQKRLEVNTRFSDEIRKLDKSKTEIHQSLLELEKQKSKALQDLSSTKSSFEGTRSELKQKIQTMEDKVSSTTHLYKDLESELQQKKQDITSMQNAAKLFLKIKSEDPDTQEYLQNLDQANSQSVDDFLTSLKSEPTSSKKDGGDIHDLPFTNRIAFLDKLKPTSHIKPGERTLCKSEKELSSAIDSMSRQEGSEGAMIKQKNFIYELDRHTKHNIKYKTEISLDAEVIQTNTVKGTTDTYYYHCALSGPEGKHYCGKTFNTKIKAKPGDIIKVIFVDISGYTDPTNKKRWVNWWAPRVHQLRTDKQTPDTIDTAWKMVKETTGRFKEKKEPTITKDHSIQQLSSDNTGTLLAVKDTRILINPGAASQLLNKPHIIIVTEDKPEYMKGLEQGADAPVLCPPSCLRTLNKYPIENIIPKKQSFRFTAPTHKTNTNKIRTTHKRPEDIKIQILVKNINDKHTFSHLEIRGNSGPKIIHRPGDLVSSSSVDCSIGSGFVLQHHWRGGSVHGDMRFRMDGHLLGFTLADGVADVFKERVGKRWRVVRRGGSFRLFWDDQLFYEVDRRGRVVKSPSKSLEAEVYGFYRGLEGVEAGWKVDWSTGVPKVRGEGREKIWCGSKANQPLGWLDVVGVTPPREVMDVPGGSRFYPGVFVEVDTGEFELGAQKPYFKEFFLRGKKLQGRVVFRLVGKLKEGKRLLNWLYWRPDDQVPYVLGKRAVKAGWLPGSGSALPVVWEKRIPDEFKFWLKKGRKSKLVARAQAVNSLIEGKWLKMRSKIKIEGVNFSRESFILSRRFWKGQEVVRKLPVVDWHLRLGRKQFHLDGDPCTKSKLSASAFTGLPGFFVEGRKPPSSPYNPNKKIPAFVKIMASGQARVFPGADHLLEAEFLAGCLKGQWVLRQSSPGSDMWSFNRANAGKSINFMFKDFDSFKTSGDLKFPYCFPAVAFAEGTWHGTWYAWEVVKVMKDLLLGANIVLDHQDTDVRDIVGQVTSTNLIPEKKEVSFHGCFLDTEKGKDAALLLDNGLVTGFSVRLADDCSYDSTGRLVANKILSVSHISLVRSPEVDVAQLIE